MSMWLTFARNFMALTDSLGIALYLVPSAYWGKVALL